MNIKARVLNVKDVMFGETAMSKLLVAVDNGEVGIIYSAAGYKVGEQIDLEVAVTKEMKFTLRPIKKG